MTTTKMQILERALKGYGNKEIAEELFISHHTVKAYIIMLLREYNAKSRFDLVYKIGYEHGKNSVKEKQLGNEE